MGLISVDVSGQHPMIPLPQITEHAVCSLSIEYQRLHRNDGLGNHGGHLMWCAARISQIDDDEASQMGQYAYSSRQITTGGFLEIKQDRRVVVLAKLFPESVQHHLPFRCKATENQDHFGRDCVDHLTNFRIVEQQVDELGNLEIINGDGWLTWRSDNEVFLYCLLVKSYIPGCNPVNGTIAKISV